MLHIGQDSLVPSSDHKVYPNIGNKKAYLTAECKAPTDFTFNPSVQIKGLMLNDYFMAVVPVMNITPDVKVSVEASFGAAVLPAGVFSLEYSENGTLWKAAPGARDTTIFKETGKYHYYVSRDNTSATVRPMTRLLTRVIGNIPSLSKALSR